MTIFKSLAGIVGRVAAIIVGAPVEPERAPTEDDLRSQQFLSRKRGLNAR